jgi:hypothetical protein
LSAAVVALSALVLTSWAVIALVHIDDNYHVTWVTGSWIALARYVNEGVLYPPLYDGHSFGGTRYMPLQFVLHAGLARLTHEYLISGKLLAYASGASLYTTAFLVYRRISGSTALALGLVTAVLSSSLGLEAATTVRGDALPAAFQLGAVAAVTRKSRTGVAVAGVLCALAFASKLTSIWGASAILIWLAIRDRERLRVFVLTLVGCEVALLGIFEAASKGRMTSNIVYLASAGEQTNFSFHVFAEKVVRLGQESGTMWILLPVAIASVVGALPRRMTIYHVSFLVAAAVVIAVLTDAGAQENHLLDLEILTGALVASAWRSVPPAVNDFVRATVLAAVLLGTLGSYVTDVAPDTQAAVHSLAGRDEGYAAKPLETVLGPDDRVLSDDAYIPISDGEDPVVIDSFMLRLIAQDHPNWQESLIREVTARRYTKIVLIRKLDLSDSWWRYFDFGVPIARAIAQNYRLVDAPRYYQTPAHRWIYAPKVRASYRRSIRSGS